MIRHETAKLAPAVPKQSYTEGTTRALLDELALQVTNAFDAFERLEATIGSVLVPRPDGGSTDSGRSSNYPCHVNDRLQDMIARLEYLVERVHTTTNSVGL